MEIVSNDKMEDDLIRRSFPIFTPRDFSDGYGSGSLTVGFDPMAPSELKRKVAAAAACFALGNSSIDHVYRNYLKEVDFEDGDKKRPDILLLQYFEELEKKILAILQTKVTEAATSGVMIGGWTLLRVPFSIRMALLLANRGAIFECVTLLRAIFEQIAWCHAIEDFDDVSKIQRTSASASITGLKTKLPNAGSIYGWLSKYTHWAYDAHAQFFVSTDQHGLTHLFGNSRLKLRCFCALFIVSDALAVVLISLASKNHECIAAVSEFNQWYPNVRTEQIELLSNWACYDSEASSLIHALA